MATMIEQRVALDEALVPSTQRFKMDTRKNIVNLEAFREMLHISPRVSGQSFAELPFEEEIVEFLRNTKAYKEYYACATGEAAPKPKASARRKIGGSDSSTTPPTPIATPTLITTIVVAPRLIAAAKGKQPARATSPIDPSDVEWTEAEQLKIVLRRSIQETYISQQGGSSTDEGTGSKPGVPDVPSDDSEEEISWNSSDDEDVDDQTKGRDDNEGEKTDESDADDDDQDDAEKDNDDDDDEEEISNIDEQDATESGEGDDEETESDGENEEEETREEAEESFDSIPRTLEDSEDDGNGKEDQGLRISMESIFTTASSSVAPLPSPTSTMTPSIITTNITTDPLQDSLQRENDEFLRTINDNIKKTIKEHVKSQVKAQVTRILPRIEESVNAQIEAKVLTRSSHSSRTSYDVAADLSEMELKKILIDKMEGNKSIQEDLRIMMIRKDPPLDQTRGLKAKRSESTFAEEPVQTTCQMEEPSHPMFETGAEDQPIVQTSQHPEWFTQPRKPPIPDRNWNETLPAVQGSTQSWISELAKQADARSSFNELLDTPIDFSKFIMNRLGVDTLTLELLAGPTYELMRGS
nr:hypothetical protein [Tanacetum cinerariifolium]